MDGDNMENMLGRIMHLLNKIVALGQSYSKSSYQPETIQQHVKGIKA